MKNFLKIINIRQIALFFLFIVILITIGIIYQVSALEYKLSKKIKHLNEINEPPVLTLRIIVPACDICIDLEQDIRAAIYSYEPEADLIVYNIDFDSKLAQDLIEQYQITKLPAMIIAGDIDKNKDVLELFKQVGQLNESTFVFKTPPVPYYDLITQKIIGQFRITYLMSQQCYDCYDVTLHRNALEGVGLNTFD